MARRASIFRLGVDGLFSDFPDAAVLGRQLALGVAEPATIALLGFGIAGLGLVRRRA